MIGEFERFGKAVWTRPAFLELPNDAKVLYLWAWTSPQATVSGLVRASPRMLSHVLEGANHSGKFGDGERSRLEAALGLLARRPLVLYEPAVELLWVVGRVEHTATTLRARTKIRRELTEAPEGVLKRRFLEAYGDALGVWPTT